MKDTHVFRKLDSGHVYMKFSKEEWEKDAPFGLFVTSENKRFKTIPNGINFYIGHQLGVSFIKYSHEITRKEFNSVYKNISNMILTS